MNPRIGESKTHLTGGKIVGQNVSHEAYSAQTAQRGEKDFVMSRGELMEFDRCPHRWLAGIESDETKQTEWGQLIDWLVLGDGEAVEKYAIAPEMYPCEPTKKDPRTEKPWNRNSTYCSMWEQSKNEAGLIVVKAETFEMATNAHRVLLAAGNDLLFGGKYQVMAIAQYKDEETGLTVPLKVLLDIVPSVDGPYGKCLCDLKTCNSAALGPWTRAVFEHGYHVQAALYLDVYIAATGEDRTDWLHLIQESYAPWEVGKRLLSAEFVELGRLKYLSALKRYCQCLKSGEWPGYDSGDDTINGWTLVQPEPWMCQ